MRFKLRKADVRAYAAGTGGVTLLMMLKRMSGFDNGLYKSVPARSKDIGLVVDREAHGTVFCIISSSMGYVARDLQKPALVKLQQRHRLEQEVEEVNQGRHTEQ